MMLSVILAFLPSVQGKETNQTENLRREFMANVSHELKTPVTVLRGSLEALRDDVVTDGAQAAKVLANAPDREGEYFGVPKVVE